MTAAIVALAVADVILAVAMLVLARAAVIERRAWSAERMALVDRAIASHMGEVIAMDRNRGGRVEKPKPDPPLIEGLS